MRMLLVCAVIALVAGAGGVRIAAAADTDPVVGTWQLNPGKSTYTGGPALQSQTRTYSQSGDKLTLDMKTVSGDGKEVTIHTTYQVNGQDFPVTGSPDYDSLSAKQVDSNTAQFVLKKGGKAVGTTTRTLSQDGKTLTAKQEVTAANGHKSQSVLVFDRQ